MAAFSLRLDLAREVNRHFLENERGDLSFFFCGIELSSKFLCKLNMGQFSVLSKKQSSEIGI